MSRPQDLTKFDTILPLRMQKKLKIRLKKLQIRKKKSEKLQNFTLSDYIRGVLAQHFRVEQLKIEEILLEKRIKRMEKRLENGKR